MLYTFKRYEIQLLAVANILTQRHAKEPTRETKCTIHYFLAHHEKSFRVTGFVEPRSILHKKNESNKHCSRVLLIKLTKFNEDEVRDVSQKCCWW